MRHECPLSGGTFFRQKKSGLHLEVGFLREHERIHNEEHYGGTMGLEIVWRNPQQVDKAEHRIEKISNQFGTVYSIISPDLSQEFELFERSAASLPAEVLANAKLWAACLLPAGR